MERDLTVPRWIDIPCPGCGIAMTTVDLNTIETLQYDYFEHVCGYKGSMEWINPESPSG
jgi:hypothetical protein